MKYFFSAISALCVVVIISCIVCCHSVSPDADEEAVLIYKPWIWGHGGVDMTPVESGLTWCWASTHYETFKIVPVKHQVDMNDLFSDDNTPLDFHTIIITQIEKGKSPILLQNYGKDWFDTNIYNYYCNLVRDHISQHSPFDLMSNRAILNEIDAKILKQMQDYVAELSSEKEFPIKIKQVTIGKATPNAEQLAEMNNTARAVQAKQTQEREAEVQIAREKAERQRAIADKAYREELGLSTQDFITLKWIETIAAKEGASIDVMVGANSTTPMWNIKR
jgi:regulator of protease activity HflC (stomatin/prohibitin superfamily)